MSYYALPYTPFAWRGGKRPVATEIWQALGDPHVTCEAFAGRVDTLFSRPILLNQPRVEIVGDLDGLIVNFWRAARHAPEELADLIDHDPISNAEMQARDRWIYENREKLQHMLITDPEKCDLRAAQYWLYQQCLLRDQSPSRKPIKQTMIGGSIEALGHKNNRELFRAICRRLQKVRLICGDWLYTCRNVWKVEGQTYGYIFDPPYTEKSGAAANQYYYHSGTVGEDAFQYAVRLGRNPNCRVVFCGFEGEYAFPKDWSALAWKSPKANKWNMGRERVWFSPACRPISLKRETAECYRA